ncbi:hypothetical protein GCWU000341_01609 [Oribacterium sp. oral taxon 078 str. F0262]|nr:hypothetical protein GCWU000341_01609 [Oribacterium sp. oral taxon 078 str. F0262]
MTFFFAFVSSFFSVFIVKAVPSFEAGVKPVSFASSSLDFYSAYSLILSLSIRERRSASST